jgi:hypothetical protein
MDFGCYLSSAIRCLRQLCARKQPPILTFSPILSRPLTSASEESKLVTANREEDHVYDYASDRQDIAEVSASRIAPPCAVEFAKAAEFVRTTDFGTLSNL